MYIKIENVMNTVRQEWVDYGGSFLVDLARFLEQKRIIKTSEVKQILEAKNHEMQMGKLIQILKKKDETSLTATMEFLESEKRYANLKNNLITAWNQEKNRRKSVQRDLGDSVYFLCSAVRAC